MRNRDYIQVQCLCKVNAGPIKNYRKQFNEFSRWLLDVIWLDFILFAARFYPIIPISNLAENFPRKYIFLSAWLNRM